MAFCRAEVFVFSFILERRINNQGVTVSYPSLKGLGL